MTTVEIAENWLNRPEDCKVVMRQGELRFIEYRDHEVWNNRTITASDLADICRLMGLNHD